MARQRFKIADIEEALRSTAGLITPAARVLESKYGTCSHNTVRAYIARHPKLQAVVTEITETQLDLAENGLVTAVRDHNLTAIIFYLKCKGKRRGYIERQQVEGPDGGPVPVRPDLSGLTVDELRALCALIEKGRQGSPR